MTLWDSLTYHQLLRLSTPSSGHWNISIRHLFGHSLQRLEWSGPQGQHITINRSWDALTSWDWWGWPSACCGESQFNQVLNIEPDLYNDRGIQISIFVLQRLEWSGPQGQHITINRSWDALTSWDWWGWPSACCDESQFNQVLNIELNLYNDRGMQISIFVLQGLEWSGPQGQHITINRSWDALTSW